MKSGKNITGVLHVMHNDKIREALGLMRSMILCGESWSDSAQKTFDDAMAALYQEQESPPVAWAAFTVDGNIRIWSANEVKAHELAAAIGQELLPLYLHSVVKDFFTTASPQTATIPDGREIAKARDAWFESKEGLDCCDFLTLGKYGHGAERFLKNRLERAFLAGSRLSAAPTHPEQPLEMVADKPNKILLDHSLELVRVLESGDLTDCVDNDGEDYQSEWLNEAIHMINRYLQELSGLQRQEAPEVE